MYSIRKEAAVLFSLCSTTNIGTGRVKRFLRVMEKKKRRMGVDTYGRSTKVEKVEESQLR